MGQIRNGAKDEHTMNIRSGLPVLKSTYGLSINEFDYLDLAVDNLRDIRNFGTTEYISYLEVDDNGRVELPCNIDTIDAVTTYKMGIKVFDTRVVYDKSNSFGTDDYFTAIDIMKNLDHLPNLGLADYKRAGFLSYQLEGKNIVVNREESGNRIAVAYTGISVDEEGYPLITRKQSNALAALAARQIITKLAMTGNKGAASTLEFIEIKASRLKQAASIPEDITDNEMDEVFNAKTSFNRKAYNRPSKISK